MTTPADISVLIPCRNGEAYLEETLQSIATQSLAPLEVLVVDDGSTDRTREIAERYAPLVRVVRNVGRGVSAARTHGQALARGAFFQFVDADDLLTPRALESRRAALDATGGDVAVSDWVRLTRVGDAWETGDTQSGGLPRGDDRADVAVLRGFWAPPAAVMYRRSICEAIGGWSPTLPIIQDARFLLDAGRLGGAFVHVAEVGARYRQHAAGSVSTRDPIAFWGDILANAIEVEALWRAAGRLDARQRRALGDVYAGCARVAFTLDRALFESAHAQLERFPDVPKPRFVRAARRLTPIVGYSAARWILSGSSSRPATARPREM